MASGVGLPYLERDLLVQRSCIDPYPDRGLYVAGRIDHLFNCSLTPDISGIDSQSISAGIQGA